MGCLYDKEGVYVSLIILYVFKSCYVKKNGRESADYVYESYLGKEKEEDFEV